MGDGQQPDHSLLATLEGDERSGIQREPGLILVRPW
jgi:hypothetical protein